MSKDALITIDGSQGEGGGQIVRSSLALSLLTGKPFTIENVRAGRKQPGLKTQHMTAVKAAARVGCAAVSGADVGSKQLTFEPSCVAAGHYEFQIRTAGSMTLVFQTIFPALMLAETPSTLKLSGGTHNMMAPPYDFLTLAYLPLVSRLGPSIKSKLTRYGFYPRGGGEFSVDIQPTASLRRMELLERGKLKHRRVRAIVSDLPRSIAERELRKIQSKSGWQNKCFESVEVEHPTGPGNVVMIELAYENVTEVFTGFGQRGVRAEQVADRAWREAKQYLKSEAPVGEHLADQLILPLGIGAHFGTGGGSFRTATLTQHSITHLEVLARFLDIDVEIKQNGEEVVVSIEPQT